MSDTILVTGGAGRIGRALVARLADGNHPITILDNYSASVPAAGVAVRTLAKDVLDVTREDLEGIDQVVHLAAVSSVPKSLSDPAQCMRVNVEGTRRLVSVLDDRHIVFASSAAVYEGSSPYAESKRAAEVEIARVGGTSLRLFNVWGPGFDEGVIARFARGERTVTGDGLQTRDFIHIDDVVDAFVAALARRAPGIYDIGTGDSVSILALAHRFGIEPEFVAPVAGDVKFSRADIKRAQACLGFQPVRRFEEHDQGMRLDLL